jgi:hypothetical protein
MTVAAENTEDIHLPTAILCARVGLYASGIQPEDRSRGKVTVCDKVLDGEGLQRL